MTNAITPRQREVLEWIAQFWVTHRYAPSFKEIGAGIGVRSTQAISAFLERLEARHLVAYSRNVSRTVRLTGAGWVASTLEPPLAIAPEQVIA